MNRAIKFCPVIGVVTPYFRLFEQWKSDIGFKTYGEGAKFIQIRRMEDVIGRKYFTIEKGYKYYEMDSGIYDAAVLRVRLWGITNESKNEEAPDIYYNDLNQMQKKSELKKLFWKKKRDKEMEEQNDFIDKLICISEKPKIETIFEEFRKKYCGTKRGFEVEFSLFKKTCKAYKLKPSEEVLKLLPSFLREDGLRMKTWRANKFFPERATLQTWLRQARWTQEFEKNKAVQANSQIERILLGE